MPVLDYRINTINIDTVEAPLYSAILELVAANESRSYLAIQNLGAQIAYIYDASSVDINTKGWALAPASSGAPAAGGSLELYGSMARFNLFCSAAVSACGLRIIEGYAE